MGLKVYESLNQKKSDDKTKGWENQETQFHQSQAILRTKIRIENGREKPIDAFAKVILTIFGKLSIQKGFSSEEKFLRPYLLIKPEDAPDILSEIEFFEGIQMPDQVEYDLFWKCVRIYLEVFETNDLF